MKGQARGVILQNGREVLLNEGGKIVLAAGALQTPRLLMTSGAVLKQKVQLVGNKQ